MSTPWNFVFVATGAALSLACRAPAQAAPPHPVEKAAGDPRRDFRPSAWQSFSAAVDVPRRRLVRELLCSASEPEVCEAACLSRPRKEAAECAIELAYRDDEEARALAQELFASTGAIAGIERRGEVHAAHLGRLPVDPLLPTGEYKQHLAWLRDALADIDRVFAAITEAAPRPILFRTRPQGFRFFKTRERSYPSAYADSGVVGYNVEGPLHDSLESVTATLLHELFHLNDEARGQWSWRTLRPLHARIVETCGEDHACFVRYAPADDRVPGGTFYAFDRRTGDAREYAAEVALRWFREHRAELGGAPRPGPPFKCGADENAQAWRAIVDEFFGGVDLVPECA